MPIRSGCQRAIRASATWALALLVVAAAAGAQGLDGLLSADGWVPQPGERAQLALDLDGHATEFRLLKQYEGTSIVFAVRDRASGRDAAVVKTNSLSTNVSAEIYAWRLAVVLGCHGVVAPVSPVTLSGRSLAKLRDLLAGVSYGTSRKEDARREGLDELDRFVAARRGQPGAIKPWLDCFILNRRLGTRELLAATDAAAWLRADGPLPGDGIVAVSQVSALQEPKGIHLGRLPARRLAADLADIMLLDALMGQDDRFAGGNLHVWRDGGERRRVGGAPDMPLWDLGEVRLLALDNGAALRPGPNTGLQDLRGGLHPGVRVERFDRRVVGRLRELRRQTAGADSARVWERLGLTGKRAELAARRLDEVLAHLDGLEAAVGEQIWLPDPEFRDRRWP
ncbi:MAG: hypothetical protein IPH09_06335 [bacterium]|nr:hypothetical protein [bacterium]